MNSRSFVSSAVIAGVVIGFLGNLPVCNLINCFLCIWVWVGGILAVYLYVRAEHGQVKLTAAQGAGLGALAGLIGAFVGVVVYLLTGFISIPLFASLERALNTQGQTPFQSGGIGSLLGSAFVFFVLDLVLYPLFGAISGVIGASVFGKEPQSGALSTDVVNVPPEG